MKILYLQLKNFATIYTAMKQKEITIDFTKCKTNIVLLVGANGSGKTSILSTLHPFAYAGNMDARSSSNLIIDDEDGYKEIHIKSDDDIYIIRHFYKNSKRGINVKSFIQKNGEELNPNGNVTSFNDTVKNELSIELDFLRLLRLGSNVSNLIDMKSTERKNFTSDLLSDINTFTDLFKKVNDDNRVLKSLIKNVSDKITKLNIVDKELLLAEIKSAEKRMEEYNTEKGKYHHRLGTLESKIKELLPDGVEAAYGQLTSFKKEFIDIERRIDSLRKLQNTVCLIYDGNINTEISRVESLMNDKNNDYKVNENLLSFYSDQLSKLYDEEEAIDNKLRMFTSDIEYSQINKLHLELSEKVKRYESEFKNYKPVYTKQELLTILTLSQQIDNVIREIYEFDTRAVKRIIELIQKNTHIEKFISKEIDKIDREILKISANFKNNSALKNPMIIFKPMNCKIDGCPYLYLHDLLFSETDNDKVSITSLETEKDILNTMLDINKNIEYIFMMLKTHSQLLSKSSISFISVNNILNTISNGSLLNGEEILLDMISESEDFEDYQGTKVKLREITSEIKLINSTKGDIEMIKNEKSKIFNKIAEMNQTIENCRQLLNKLDGERKALSSYHNDLRLYRDCDVEIEDITKDKNVVQNIIDETNKKISDADIYIKEIMSIRDMIRQLDWNIEKLNEDLLNKKISIKEFDTLSREHQILNEQFEEVAMIRKALSSTEGIPLLFIQLYLKNTKMYVNDLLSSVYSEDFEIDDFEISSTEFNIPYIKNGIRINDVAYASQGEKSFLSLALSFALITQSIKDYNILLLDEIDSTLDTKNRSLFLTILEKQMEIIDAEQVFLITHNNMFDNYPVDIIMTSSGRLDNYNNANLIYSN